MKIVAWTVVLLAATCTVTAGERTCDVKCELVEMGAADQAIRKEAAPILATGDFRSDAFRSIAGKISSLSARHLAKLREITERSGWPDVHIVGIDASNAAFLILQHSPTQAQKEFLPMFREAALRGKARRDHLAMLEDRILVSDGEKQRYGTQISAGADGVPRVSPVEDPGNLNDRRRSVGLPSMEEYLQHMEAELGRAIDKSALAVQPAP